jgi:alkanesulfonate monooxygenase SsuD/methylene tetrahydromethanopterin reductase-like flavin-dependent oxidoreductase (luciferase family)
MLPVGYFACTQVGSNTASAADLIDEIVEQAVVGESVGFDGFYFPEHHQQADAFMPNPMLLSTFVGMRTQRMKVGPAVLLAPLYHPIHIAEDAAMIDLATRGRFICAVGIGYIPIDFEAFGVPTRQRVGRTEECIEILRRAWSGETFSYPSKYHTIENVCVTPTPYREGGPPIWVGAWSPPGMERAGRMADALIADPIQSLPVIKDHARQYREVAKKHGRKPYYVLMRDCVIGKDHDSALAKSEPMMVKHRWYFEHGAHVIDEYLEDVPGPDELTFDICSKDRFIAGSPEECLEQLQAWKEEVQPDYLILRMRHSTGPVQAEALEDIRLFGEKVIPHL